MQTSPTLLTASTLAISLGWVTMAQAKDPIALSFDLEPSPINETPATQPKDAVALLPENATPLPIPPEATRPPLGTPHGALSPQNNYGGGDALALATRPAGETPPLPAPPPFSPSALSPAPLTAPNAVAAPELTPLNIPESVDIALQFDLPREANPPPAPVINTALGSTVDNALTPLFSGGADSLVARAVGSAEGTRTPNGERTPAYFGHVDPGNAVWNLGSFSYQHGADSPAAADQKQLQRLQFQAQQLQAKAVAHNLELSTAALLNGIDLANQAPMAALDRWGYIERLAQAQQSGLADQEAIVWARTRAFLDPDTQRWNAPGLGNTIDGISQDQTRRVRAIARALAINPPAATPQPNPTPPTATDEALDSVLFQPLNFSSLDPEPISPDLSDLSPTAPALPSKAPPTAQTQPAAPVTPGATAKGAIPTTQVLPPHASDQSHPPHLEEPPISLDIP